jgi:hypothetical protein
MRGRRRPLRGPKRKNAKGVSDLSNDGNSMEPFARALKIVSQVMREGALSHPENDWRQRNAAHHLRRAESHLHLLRDGDQSQDHLSHAATRLLMALTLRELEGITFRDET